MRSPAASFAILALLWLSAPVAAGPAVAPATGPAAAPTAAGAVTPAAGPAVTVVVDVRESGDAHWNVTARFALNSTNETAAFDRLAADFRRGEATTGFSATTFRALASAAANRTGREMDIREVERDATLLDHGENATGLLSLEFVWTGFASTEGPGVVVGDVFEGRWSLAADHRLVVYPPPGFGAENVRPGPDQVQHGGLVWEGPRTFTASEPAITFARGVTTQTPTTTPPGGDGNERRSLFPLLAGGLVAAVAALAALWWYARRDRGVAGEGGPGAVDAPDGGSAGAGEAAPERADAGASGEAAGAGAGAGEGAAEESGGEEVDLDLLSDEERVERLLRRNDGRMKQASIVDETDWSNAKVSQLLSSMAEEGRVEKLRIGRENLITLVENEEQA
ncbi:MAG: helix-turn-helix transcriptional regulator [Halobacteriaceae archaeon]